MAMDKQCSIVWATSNSSRITIDYGRRWDTVEVVVFDVDESGFVMDQNRARISLLFAV